MHSEAPAGVPRPAVLERWGAMGLATLRGYNGMYTYVSHETRVAAAPPPPKRGAASRAAPSCDPQTECPNLDSPYRHVSLARSGRTAPRR